jgi:hypothetical protein
MPFFALSNLLTLFSHDMPTLALIQHLFDYLLCRHPLASVYVAAAVRILPFICIHFFNKAILSLSSLVKKRRSDLKKRERRECCTLY